MLVTSLCLSILHVSHRDNSLSWHIVTAYRDSSPPWQRLGNAVMTVVYLMRKAYLSVYSEYARTAVVALDGHTLLEQPQSFSSSLFSGDKVVTNVVVRISYVTYKYLFTSCMRVCNVHLQEPALLVSLLSLSMVICKQKERPHYAFVSFENFTFTVQGFLLPHRF